MISVYAIELNVFKRERQLWIRGLRVDDDTFINCAQTNENLVVVVVVESQ